MVDVEHIRNSYDLREIASQDCRLHKESVRELAGPCPKCGGNDRFHVTGERFMCRSCHPEWGDVIEYVSWLHELDFLAAVEHLGERGYPTGTFKEQAITPLSETQWHEQAERFAERAMELLGNSENVDGAAYLLSRGIYPSMWETFRLGFAPRVYVPLSNETAPSISIPWFRQNSLVGIRFRFLEEQEGYTKTAYAGSNFSGTLYGGHALKGRDNLMLCEGELNAVSIWQDTDVSDVLSIGSETTAITESMQKHLARWNTISVWADKEERAEYIASHFQNSHIIQSGQDANELLQMGELREFLEEQTGKKG